MTWSSSTSDADPGAGKIAFNNGTLGSVSILYVDDVDDASATISGFVQSWDDVSNGVARGIVTVTKEGTPSTYAMFKVTGAVTNATGYSTAGTLTVSGTLANTALTVSSGATYDVDATDTILSIAGAGTINLADAALICKRSCII